MKAGAKPPAPPPPAAKGPVLTDKKPAMPPAAVEEAGGASGVSEDPNSQWKLRYDAAMKLARETGTDEAWQEVFRLKREKTAA